MHTELVVVKAVTIVLGLAIAVQTYRGGHRHASRPMFSVSPGFVLISAGAMLESVFIDLAGSPIRQAGIVQSGLVAAGMLLILYALYGGKIA